MPTSLTTLTNLGSISSTTTLSPGDYQYWMINLSGQKTVTLTGPINLYLTGTTAISISGQAQVYIDPASAGPVNIYFDGDVSLTGQGITNATSVPSNLIMYGTGVAQDIKLAGQGDFYGAIYAPDSDLKLTGQGALYGAFVGNTVTISGQGGIHYDAQLGSAGASAATSYSITSWSDTQNAFGVFQ
ncbi:MAG: collagen-binding domain-containing protein [Candidatus Omnitrophota bacterium]